MIDKYDKLHKKISKKTGYSVRVIEAIRTQVLGGGINPEDLKEFALGIMRNEKVFQILEGQKR